MDENFQQTNQNEKPFDICERTFCFAIRVVNFCAEMDRTPGVTWTLSKQLLRSGTSIGANVEEGQGAQARLTLFPNTPLPARKLAKQAIGCDCCRPLVSAVPLKLMNS